MIVYVETHNIKMKNDIIADIGCIIGVNNATVLVNNWYTNYSSFVYDKTTGDLIFSKSRYAGYWENSHNLDKYKFKVDVL